MPVRYKDVLGVQNLSFGFSERERGRENKERQGAMGGTLSVGKAEHMVKSVKGKVDRGVPRE